MLRKYRFLSANDAVSKQEMMNVEAELLEQKAKLDAYRREEAGLLQEIRTQNLTFTSLPNGMRQNKASLNAPLPIFQEVLILKCALNKSSVQDGRVI